MPLLGDALFVRSARDAQLRLVQAFVCLFALLSCATAHAQTEASTTLYIRTDTDHTTVITPRLHVAAPVAEGTRLDLVYTVDVWTSASVDIRASASKPITERRDEIHANVSHEFQDLTLSGGYRYSTEPDYQSHAVFANASFDLADNSATLAFGGSVSLDTVGRVGFPSFSRPTQSYSLQASYLQVLDPRTLLQFVYELGYADGYLASPYRFVGIGSPDGTCHAPGGPGSLEYCVPEANPDERMRHAVLVQFRRALGADISLGLAYRFYIDDWRMLSHTVLADLSWNLSNDTLLALRYRFYLQNAAFQYKPTYAPDYLDPNSPTYNADHHFVTRDKELSAFTTHRFAIELEHNWSVGDLGQKLKALVVVAPSIYLYQNFVPLKSIEALDLTFSMVLTL
jgi:hypothetical protein